MELEVECKRLPYKQRETSFDGSKTRRFHADDVVGGREGRELVRVREESVMEPPMEVCCAWRIPGMAQR